MTPVIVATILVCWTVFSVVLAAAWSMGAIKYEVKPTKGWIGWMIKLAINGLFIWAVIYLART